MHLIHVQSTAQYKFFFPHLIESLIDFDETLMFLQRTVKALWVILWLERDLKQIWNKEKR